jgi:division protein CdvB (Snf7/Vps24/ESCRT-III family)
MKYKLNQYAKKVNKAQEDGDDEDVAINMKDLEKIRKVAKVEL